MNEEFNPYAPQQNAENPYQPQEPQPYVPQQPYEQQPAYPLQNREQPVQTPQYAPYQQPYQQQNYYQYPQQPSYSYTVRAPRQPGNGGAKAFTIVSFAAGCVSLLIVLLCLFAVAATGAASSYPYSYYSHSSATEGIFAMTMSYSLILGIPGLVFGVLALVKKTRLVPMAVLGVVFNSMLLLSSVISFVTML